MWKKWILYGVTAVACAVLVQQVATTVYLAQIDYGLRSSLQSTRQLAEIQNSIIEKNNALHGLASTAKQMNQQLGATLVVTQQIDENIGAINHLNKATLDINQTLVTAGQHSHANLTGVAQQLAKLNHSISALSQSIGGLESILASDAAAPVSRGAVVHPRFGALQKRERHRTLEPDGSGPVDQSAINRDLHEMNQKTAILP